MRFPAGPSTVLGMRSRLNKYMLSEERWINGLSVSLPFLLLHPLSQCPKQQKTCLTGRVVLIWVSSEADRETQMGLQAVCLKGDSGRHWQRNGKWDREGADAHNCCDIKSPLWTSSASSGWRTLGVRVVTLQERKELGCLSTKPHCGTVESCSQGAWTPWEPQSARVRAGRSPESGETCACTLSRVWLCATPWTVAH